MIKRKPFKFEKHNETGKKLQEFQDYLFELRQEINIAGYAKIYSAAIQVSKKITRLQHLLDDQCLKEYSEHEAVFLYFNRD